MPKFLITGAGAVAINLDHVRRVQVESAVLRFYTDDNPETGYSISFTDSDSAKAALKSITQGFDPLA